MNQFQLKNLLYHVIALESLYLSYHDFYNSHNEISHFRDQDTFMTLIIQWNNCEYFNNVFIYSYEFMDPFLLIWCSFAVSVVCSKSIRKLRNETWEYCENQIRLNKKFPFLYLLFFHAFTRKKASFKNKNLIVGTVLPPIQEIL